MIEKVVVIAASAGGIDALMQVLSRLPADLPAAVLIVQHLRDDRPTRLHEHLARHSSLPVHLAEDGADLEAGVACLGVPGQHLRIEDGRLALDSGEPVHYVRPSADVLFTSAAQTFGSKVIGVVLSGTGSDGARGCQEIKAKGGTTIAQDEKTSRYFAMPGAAIEADAIDYVLPLKEIAGKIVECVKRKDVMRDASRTTQHGTRTIERSQHHEKG
jgi:two-component system chemotaxis response regulator CheB